MRSAAGTDAVGARIAEAIADRSRANRELFDHEAERIARLCHRMAERFASGGRLLGFGHSAAARSDARHVAVEFVHPVIVGKRALPAIGIAAEGGPLERQIDLLAQPGDIAIAFGADEPGGAAARALALARGRGCLTVAFGSDLAEWNFVPPSDDPSVRQELVETLYHVLWELVHVFFEHKGLLEGRDSRTSHDVGASSFLYPFLAETEHDLDAVVDDVRQSVLAKAEEIGTLREQTLDGNVDELVGAARAMRACFDAGGKLLALGNGGSATDAMDVVADFQAPLGGLGPGRPALDLTEDPSIITAVANDVGVDAIFTRQVIAYGKPGDVLLALSTSGGSENVIAALGEARRRGLVTVALLGYDGGKVVSDGLADHALVVRSQHIPRIQEAQATLYHLLRELVEMAS